MFIFYSKLVPGHLSLFLICQYFHLCFYLMMILCLCVFVWKKIVRKRKGKAKDKVSGQLFCIFSQAEEGQVWELYKARSLLIFPDSISASLTLPWRVCRGPKAFSKHQSVDAKQTNYYPPLQIAEDIACSALRWVWLCITTMYMLDSYLL